jgi:hypothetical protein
MDKINPLLYITDTDPVPEAVLDASSWFETEWTTLDWFEEGVTSEDSVVTLAPSWNSSPYIPWMLAQGWMVDDHSQSIYYWNPNVDPVISIYHTTLTFKRRKIQSERVLQDMITEFTDAYNEGREINDRRYDELVALYDVMLDKSETAITSTESIVSAYDALITAAINALPTDFASHSADVSGLLDDFGESHRERVNTQFDNELAKARQDLTSRGMYNSTIWTSSSAGIETQRAKALTDLEDKITERQLASKDRLHVLHVEMRRGMIEAYHRLLAMKQDATFKPLDLRNTVLSAMLGFMERRQDEYPGLEGLANIAAQLGYGEGGTVTPPVSTP